ncbi:hypothetical protein MBLNU459_g1508t1 [Dothideomycetes sp. NU459]
MATSLAPHQQFGALPHRRPLPSNAQPFAGIAGPADQFSHSRSRTTSSNVLPVQPYAQPPMPQQQQQQQQPPLPVQSSRRTLSNATTSTSSSTYPQNVPRTTATAPSSYASSIRRSTSSRSNNTPSSYVALMRKQKATVWCDRAQHEDPRLLAQQRAAKMRATQEVVGGVSATAAGRSSTSSGGMGIAGGVRSKIRHHGAVKASAYSGAGNLSGAGVPMRLSASEVDEENSEDEDRSASSARYHQRNQSGRSSLGSGHRNQTYLGGTSSMTGGAPPGARFSAGSTPPSEDQSRTTSLQHGAAASPLLAEDETPVPEMYRNDYFTQTGGSGGSGSSEEARFGDVGGLPAKSAAREGYGGSADQQQQQQRKTSEELRRRGSVDDRTMTMSGVRLFVANPDLSD